MLLLLRLRLRIYSCAGVENCDLFHDLIISRHYRVTNMLGIKSQSIRASHESKWLMEDLLLCMACDLALLHHSRYMQRF